MEKQQEHVTELINMLVNKYDFDGFYHYSDISNLHEIIESGRLICRSRNNAAFQDAADKNALGKTLSWIFDQVRLFYFSKAPFLYKNEGIKPKNESPHMPIPVALVFDERIAYLPGVKFLDGSAINLNEEERHQTHITKDAKEALTFNWDFIVYRGAVPTPWNNMISVFGETDGTKITNYKNAELLITNELSLSYLKKIKFRSQADLKQAKPFLDKYESISVVDNSTFNCRCSYLEDYEIQWDIEIGDITIYLKHHRIDRINEYEHIIKTFCGEALIDEYILEPDEVSRPIKFYNARMISRIEYYMNQVLCAKWEA